MLNLRNMKNMTKPVVVDDKVQIEIGDFVMLSIGYAKLGALKEVGAIDTLIEEVVDMAMSSVLKEFLSELKNKEAA